MKFLNSKVRLKGEKSNWPKLARPGFEVALLKVIFDYRIIENDISWI
jgi:hypothetical protein